MGRLEPSYAPMAQQSFRKDQRAKNARGTINKLIPQILASDTRARKGIENAFLFPSISGDEASSKAKPRPLKERKTSRTGNDVDENDDSQGPSDSFFEKEKREPLIIRIEVTDTLTAAHELQRTSRSKKNVAILNMASPLRPGGGVLNGATSQEESLCSRTTLLPSLREEWYRLPEIGGIFSPDVLVFRLSDGGEDRDLAKTERFYIDVVSAAMTRFPAIVEVDKHAHDVAHTEDSEEGPSSLTRMYANQKDRDLALEKMRAVIKVLVMRKVERVVLGAWGCGAYGNPVNEICTTWKKALRGTKSKNSDVGSIKEVVFAIKDPKMARQFASCWGEGIEVKQRHKSSKDGSNSQENHVAELTAKIAALEVQLKEVKTPILRQGLEGTLHTLRGEIAKLSEQGSRSESEEDD